MEPIVREAELESRLPAEEATSRVKGALEARGAAVTMTPTGLEASGGSRLALRLWGVYLKAGSRRLPWRATVDVQTVAAEHLLIRVSAASDEGFMVARVPKSTALYDALLTDVVASVAAATAD